MQYHAYSILIIYNLIILGLRGAIAYALCLHTELESEEKRHVLVTTTLIIVLFTILFLGGSTMPLLKVPCCPCLVKDDSKAYRFS